MQEQKKANVLPGQVTLEDVQREAEKEQAIEIEIREPGEPARIIRARSYSLSYLDLDSPEGKVDVCFKDGLDAILCYVIMRKNIARIRQRYPETLAMLEGHDDFGTWLDEPQRAENEEE